MTNVTRESLIRKDGTLRVDLATAGSRIQFTGPNKSKNACVVLRLDLAIATVPYTIHGHTDNRLNRIVLSMCCPTCQSSHL